MTLTVPKLRSFAFETAIIERYRWRDSSVEEALIGTYFAASRRLHASFVGHAGVCVDSENLNQMI